LGNAVLSDIDYRQEKTRDPTPLHAASARWIIHGEIEPFRVYIMIKCHLGGFIRRILTGNTNEEGAVSRGCWAVPNWFNLGQLDGIRFNRIVHRGEFEPEEGISCGF